jgi:defect-in-organelle-trafficking protein DotC
MRNGLKLAASLAALLASSACNGPMIGMTPVSYPGATTQQAASDIPLRADVNPNYTAGDLDIPTPQVPTLEQVINQTPKPSDAPENDEDRLRAPAMRDAALSYGARAGLAWASQGINQTLKSRAAELTKTYDFNRLLIDGPSGSKILPPVISEANGAWESFDAGKTLRVADTVYQIIEQARFTPVAPLWHTYLIRTYTAPEMPPDALLPRSDGERDAWRKWVTQGWMMGLKQADEIFKSDLNRLERDFTGMVKYKALVEQGKVSKPTVAEGNLGVTGTGQDMRVNDKAIRITKDPTLQTDPSKWQSAPSDLPPPEAATPPGQLPVVPTDPTPKSRRY